jgi:hypothetical protein
MVKPTDMPAEKVPLVFQEIAALKDRREAYERNVAKLLTGRDYSKTITVTTGGYLDNLPAKDRKELIELTATAARDRNWDVRVAGQHYNS